MKTPPLNEYEKHQIDMIEREIKSSDLEMRLYIWLVIPSAVAFVIGTLYFLL